VLPVAYFLFTRDLVMFKRLVSDAFHLVFWNLEAVFKTTGAWFVILFVAGLGVQVVFGQSLPGAVPTSGQLFGSLLIFALALASSASIAVAWHRYGLLGDQPGLIHLTFGKIEAIFLAKSIMLGLLVGILALFIGFLGAAVSVPVITGVIAVLAMIFLVPTFMRLSLILPATAVERPIGLGEAYRVSEGLGWRMFFATLVLSLPFAVVTLLLQMLITQAAGGLPVILIQLKALILNVLLQIIVTVLGLSVLTSGYRMAMERAQQGATTG